MNKRRFGEWGRGGARPGYLQGEAVVEVELSRARCDLLAHRSGREAAQPGEEAEVLLDRQLLEEHVLLRGQGIGSG
jgi:hypothetical protein